MIGRILGALACRLGRHRWVGRTYRVARPFAALLLVQACTACPARRERLLPAGAP